MLALVAASKRAPRSRSDYAGHRKIPASLFRSAFSASIRPGRSFSARAGNSIWVIGAPFSLKGLQGNQADGEDLVIYDDLGAGAGSRIGFSEGAEAAQPFQPEKKPVDAYCACILDKLAIS